MQSGKLIKAPHRKKGVEKISHALQSEYVMRLRPCLIAKRGKRSLIGHRQLGEHLTVHIDAGFLEAVHEAGIVHAVDLACALMRVIKAYGNHAFELAADMRISGTS